VRAVVNNVGTVVASGSYDAFGTPNSSSTISSQTPFGFGGGYTDATGLVYLLNRYYDPATGQFLSIDPLVDETGQPYSYTGGDPVNGGDPTGMCVSLFGIACIGGGPVTTAVSLRFDPGAGANAIVNVGRGASFGLSDQIANWISPGASCTVPQNSIDQFIGGTASSVVAGEWLRGLVAAEDEGATSEELQQTAHGLERSLDPSRLSVAEQQNVIANATQEFTQGESANVYVQQIGDRYNVVVQGQNGVITNLKGVSGSSLNRLASNYGWIPK